MRQAVRLALRARGRTSPNPLVGCVIVRDGRVLATGWHKRAGEDHAEAAALRKLGWRAPRATVYVTLEPHGFHGRTPPCTERLIEAKVARVVVGMKDPNPRVHGAGLKQLARAGITVDAGVLGEACAAINRPYLTYVAEKRPWVTLKAAVTLDGRLAARGGDARWVSGERSRLEAHRMRDTVGRHPGRRQHGAPRRSGADHAAAERARARSQARHSRRAADGAAGCQGAAGRARGVRA